MYQAKWASPEDMCSSPYSVIKMKPGSEGLNIPNGASASGDFCRPATEYEQIEECNFSIRVSTSLSLQGNSYGCRSCVNSASFTDITEYLCHNIQLHLSNLAFFCNICQTSLENADAVKSHIALHPTNDLNISETREKTAIKSEVSDSATQVDQEQSHFPVASEPWDSVSEDSEDQVVLSKLKRSLKKSRTKDKKTIKCEHCSKCFAYRSAYNKHVKFHDECDDGDCFLCDNCGRQCPTRHAYTEHRRRGICGVFFCPKCFQTFSALKLLKSHFRDKHAGKLAKCKYCAQVFEESLIEAHYTALHADKPKIQRSDTSVECEICKKKLRNKTALEKHIEKHLSAQLDEKSFLCMYCGKTFTLDSSLKIHLRIHNNDFRYRCDVCGEGFVTKGYLKRHFYKHSGEKIYKCPLCPESFNYRRAFQQHRLIVHLVESQYKCDICGSNYESKSRFERHKRIYAGKCAPVCRYCNVKVPRGILKRHELTHTDTKLFACTLCPKRFTRRENFEQHQNIHSGERPYKCTECDQAFHIYATLFAHRMKHEGKKYKKSPNKIVMQCSECVYTCSSRLLLNTHLLKKHGVGEQTPEVFHCAQCEYSSNKRANVYAHRRKYHGNKKWDCTYCGKSFTIKFKYVDHMNCHTGAAPHKCPGCPKTFSQRKNMWQHRDKYCPVVAKRRKM